MYRVEPRVCTVVYIVYTVNCKVYSVLGLQVD